jgi:hypothetical protein
MRQHLLVSWNQLGLVWIFSYSLCIEMGWMSIKLICTSNPPQYMWIVEYESIQTMPYDYTITWISDHWNTEEDIL